MKNSKIVGLYLQSLDAETLKIVIGNMADPGNKAQRGEATCKGAAKPTTGPTPNGYYSCETSGWVWNPLF